MRFVFLGNAAHTWAELQQNTYKTCQYRYTATLLDSVLEPGATGVIGMIAAAFVTKRAMLGTIFCLHLSYPYPPSLRRVRYWPM
jgi:hypothetical protein